MTDIEAFEKLFKDRKIPFNIHEHQYMLQPPVTFGLGIFLENIFFEFDLDGKYVGSWGRK